MIIKQMIGNGLYLWKRLSLINFLLCFRLHRDHLRLHTLIIKFEDYEEVLIKNEDWYWMGKVKFNF